MPRLPCAETSDILATDHGVVKCSGEPCVVNEKSKDREKRLMSCNNPGCNKRFHVTCAGHAKVSDRDLSKIFLFAFSVKSSLIIVRKLLKKLSCLN